MNQRMIRALRLSAMACFLALPAWADNLPSIADTYVTSNNGGSALNFGTNINMIVGPNTSSKALVQFDLTPLPSGTQASNVNKAILYLYVKSVTTAGHIDVSDVQNAWAESVVTFGNAPGQGAVQNTVAVGAALNWIAVDVTALVQAWVANPSSNRGVMITASASDPNTTVNFDTKETTLTGHPAMLDVVLNLTPGATGATGLQGPAGAPGPAGAMGPQGGQGVAGPVGATGAQGVSGIAGPAGATGAQGPQGAAGATGAQGLTWQQAWISNTTYTLNDAVQYNGSAYISVQPGNAGNVPGQTPAFWSLLASSGVVGATGTAGPAGATGTPGPQGIAGPMGAAGAPGPQGIAGANGAPGLQGAAGPAGAAGVQGPQGVAGATGAQGLTWQQAWISNTTYALNDAVQYNGSSYISLQPGNSGNLPDQSPTFWSLLAQTGSTGATGATGAPGPQGLVGPSGATGAQGLQGVAGSTGAQGLQGVAGATGSQGLQGVPGATGQQGLQGAAGATGPQGLQGVAGATGPQGLQGVAGTVGAQGLQGVAGATGAQGLQGVAGATGAQGLPGANGATGIQGAVGATGTQGLQGVTGSTGIQGIQGTAGATGLPGVRGVTGTTGAAGATGLQGLQGVAGPTGVAGTQGPIGPAGATGAQGTAGIQGPAGPTGAMGATGATGAAFTGNIRSPLQVATLHWYQANATGSSYAIAVAASNGLVGMAFDGTNIWVPTSGNAVTKLLASTGAIVGTYTVGVGPVAVAFDGVNIWVASSGGTVTKLLASTGAVVGTYTVGGSPTAIAYDGANIWVANTIPVSAAFYLLGTPCGSFGSPSSSPYASVTKLLASTGAVVGTYAVGGAPTALTFDGVNVWVANSISSNGGGCVTQIIASTGVVATTWGFLSDLNEGVPPGCTSNNLTPTGLAFDGTNLWIADFFHDGLIKLNVAGELNVNGRVYSVIPSSTGSACNAGPKAVLFDGTNIWVTNRTNGGVTKLDTSGNILGIFQPVGYSMIFDGTNVWSICGAKICKF
jgi:hypothetical protein